MISKQFYIENVFLWPTKTITEAKKKKMFLLSAYITDSHEMGLAAQRQHQINRNHLNGIAVIIRIKVAIIAISIIRSAFLFCSDSLRSIFRYGRKKIYIFYD